MNKLIKSVIIIISNVIIWNTINSISLVYNIKIRRTFSLLSELSKGKKRKYRYIATAVPIVYKRNRHIVTEELNVCEYRRSSGSIFNFRCTAPTYWWIEASTGLERECACLKGSLNRNFSRTGLDDIIISGGKNFFPRKHTQFVLYGLAGFPVERDVSLVEAQDTLVGTRFFSIGAGSELSYAFFESLRQSLIGVFQVRFLHFFDRSWFPILPYNATIQPGNVTDLLWTLQYRFKTNILEAGYNTTFFTNQAVLLETERRDTEAFLRKSFYVTYNKVIPKIFSDKHLVVGAGINNGSSDRYNTNIITSWFTCSIIF